jgi:hypothetical protein
LIQGQAPHRFGLKALVTTFAHDAAGRIVQTDLPDGGATYATFYDSGALKKSWGSGKYPVEYSYDYAGRMKTLNTWKPR